MERKNYKFPILAAFLIVLLMFSFTLQDRGSVVLAGSSLLGLGLLGGVFWTRRQVAQPVTELDEWLQNLTRSGEGPASLKWSKHNQFERLYRHCQNLSSTLQELRAAKENLERQLVSSQNSVVILEAQNRELERNLQFHKNNLKEAQNAIQELRRAEKTLTLQKNLAEKNSQAKSEFLARMSHEIRTPMNAIMGMAELLKETKLNADQEYYVTIFCKAGEVLLSLVNDILDLSKIEAGEICIENLPFSLSKLSEEIEQIMKPRASAKGLQFSWEISPQIADHIVGDPNKIRQIMINLVGNSLKFTETGSIRIHISKNPARKDSLLFSVTDSGVGISPHKQHLIFKKFTQGDSSITRRYGGTGLGLAISKSLVELMGGSIWFKSREGAGSTFFFTLPYHEQPLNIGEPAAPQTPPVTGEQDHAESVKKRDPNKKIRILVADDAEDNRTLFTHYLKNGPYEIIEAHNGLEAMDKIKSEKFDIVFMDVQMPEMDGYAATDSVRKWENNLHKSPVPIIALTAHALSEDRQKSLDAGCNDHIAKPFRKETLLGVINRYSL